MQRLLWIGSPFFAHALADCGFEVCVHNFETFTLYGWDDLVRVAGWEPDVLVVADKSRPPFVLGMERFPCRTVFYGVDSHIHGWFPWYAQAFDLCLLSLRDHLDGLRQRRLDDDRLIWSPPFAPDLPGTDLAQVPHPQEKDMDVLFVGTVSQHTPWRKRFLDMLGERLPNLCVTRGKYQELYPRAKIVLNICEHGDLNFRVFEALGCGACLVTPHVEHGFDQLFQNGVHLLSYALPDSRTGMTGSKTEVDDAESTGTAADAALSKTVDAAEIQIRNLLSNPSQRDALASTGLAAVNAAHRASHRARALAAALEKIPPGTAGQRQAEAEVIRKRWLRFFYLLQAQAMPLPDLAEAYVAAAAGRFM